MQYIDHDHQDLGPKSLKGNFFFIFSYSKVSHFHVRIHTFMNGMKTFFELSKVEINYYVTLINLNKTIIQGLHLYLL